MCTLERNYCMCHIYPTDEVIRKSSLIYRDVLLRLRRTKLKCALHTGRLYNPHPRAVAWHANYKGIERELKLYSVPHTNLHRRGLRLQLSFSADGHKLSPRPSHSSGTNGSQMGTAKSSPHQGNGVAESRVCTGRELNQ